LRSKSRDLFSKRPATSPMPKVPTPKRPRKQARSRAALMRPPTPQADDDDDPLSLSYDAVDDILVSMSPPPPPARWRKGDTSISLTTRKARRQTLDEEIRIAEEDGRMDSGILVAVGSRSKKKGFLAGGGAAGPPIFMGIGYVDGAEESDHEDNDRNSESERTSQQSMRRR